MCIVIMHVNIHITISEPVGILVSVYMVGFYHCTTHWLVANPECKAYSQSCMKFFVCHFLHGYEQSLVHVLPANYTPGT